ncbi:MAG: aminodeoxychorismate synthase component I [Sulfurimonas sp.]|nr:aminodeoxychorismate synthase component I [Sulfurimonas sp.]
MLFSDLNFLGKNRKSFLVICDFKVQNLKIIPLDKLEENDIEYKINNSFKAHKNTLKKYPQSFTEYKKKFDFVQQKIKSGDTYLLNLTQETQIETDLTLKEIFKSSNAQYKLRYKDEFVCFSPEKFIQIQDDKIHTYPMKGTIDASVPNAKEKILNNKKEIAEHIMVVDLLRNDLSIVAKDVKVENFRYVEEVEAGDKKLLHISSHISGEIGSDWHEKIGDILKALLPAGSISGTPKKSTIDIIKHIENYDRDFFSGIFGIYNGKTFDSGVMIRFIQKNEDGYIYKSGGGITLDSEVESEYSELLDKVYLP